MFHTRIAASTLSRRDNYFVQEATVYEKVAVALDALSIVVGIVLVVLAIVALARAGGHRLPFVVLLFGTVCYLLSRALEIAYRVLAYDDSTFGRARLTLLSLTVADTAFTVFADIAALLAATLVLWNRQSSLAFAHPTEKPNLPKRLLDAALVAILVVFNVAIQGLVGNALQQVANGLISSSTYLERYQTSLNLTHVYTVFYFFTVVNIIVTGILLKSKISRVGTKQCDKPVNTVLFVLAPLLLVHWFWFLFQGAWYAARVDRVTRSSDLIVMDVSVAEYMVFPACIAIVLAVLGIRSTIWNTFGDQPLAGRPTFYPQQQQPLYGQQPVYGQPVAIQQLPGHAGAMAA